MQNVVQALMGPNGLAETEARKTKQIAAVLLGLDELAAYSGLRPDKRCEFKMPTPVYLKFWQLTRNLRDEGMNKIDSAQKMKMPFTVFVPFPLYLEFKRLNKELRDRVPAEHRDSFSMTSWCNLATANILIPALEGVVLRANSDPEFKSEVLQNKGKYTMTAWFIAALEKNIIPAIGEAILHVKDASAIDQQAA